MIVLRDSDRGVEVFCVLRHARSGFLGGAVVFPGGKVDALDASDVWAERATEPHARSIAFAGDASPSALAGDASPSALADDASPSALAGDAPGPSPRTLAVAACRETLEEGSILPVRGGTIGDEEVKSLGKALRAGELHLADALAKRGLKLALDALVPWARWITPEAESRRFDARFYLLALPEGQSGCHDEHETTMSFWATPKEVLDRFARGLMFLAPPTTRSLELLAPAANVEGALAIAERQSLSPICPRFMPGEDGGAPYLALPGDPSHEVRERRVEGPTRFVLRDGIFVSAEGAL